MTEGTRKPVYTYDIQPVDRMEAFLADRGFGTPNAAVDVLGDWARACRFTFNQRQPQLHDQVWDEIWNCVPFGQNLLWVVSVKPEDATQGGILIPDKAQQTQEEGWVCNVGWGICDPEPNSQRRAPFENPLDMVGRRIFWSRYAGIDLGVNAVWTQPRDERGKPIGLTPRVINGRSQYSQLRVGDVFGFSLRTGGTVL